MNRYSSDHGPGLRQRVISSVVWLAVLQYSGQIISWGMTIFVIRLLSPDDYGLMAKATVCIGFMMMISELGLTAAIIQVKDLGDREISQTYGFVIATNCVMMILLCTGAALISNFFGDARLIRIYQVLSLVFMISSVYIVPQSLLMRRMNFRSKAAIDLIAALVGSATTLVTALTGFKVWSLVWGLLANQVALAVGYNMLSGRLFWPSFNFSGFGKMFSFGSSVSGSRILWYIYSSADMFIGSRFLKSKDLGIYSMAITLACIPLDKLSPIINQVAFSAYSIVQDEHGMVKRNFLASVRLLSLIVFPLCWGLLIVAPEILSLLGEKWHDAVLPIRILCVIMPFRAVGSLLAPVLQGIGRPNTHLLNLIITTSIMVPSFLIGSKAGAYGLSLAWLAGYLVTFTISTLITLKAIDVSIREMVACLVTPVIATGAMLSSVLLLKMNFLSISLTFYVAAAVMIGFAVYTMMIRMLNQKLLDELITIFRRSRAT